MLYSGDHQIRSTRCRTLPSVQRKRLAETKTASDAHAHVSTAPKASGAPSSVRRSKTRPAENHKADAARALSCAVVSSATGHARVAVNEVDIVRVAWAFTARARPVGQRHGAGITLSREREGQSSLALFFCHF
ncbi:MAG: hypothetical protein DMG27_00100 [Acidobacteria bacterium]|nr:MAG: hypothetical protein DMG27_00100 [Acidobacteriota bacterium]